MAEDQPADGAAEMPSTPLVVWAARLSAYFLAQGGIMLLAYAIYGFGTDPNSFARGSRTAIAPSFGLGLNFWLSDLISLGVEYRAMPFSWNRGGFDTRGGPPNGNFPDGKIDSNDQTFKFNQMLSLSIGFALGHRGLSKE